MEQHNRGERQKDVSENYRSSYDRIFGKDHKPERGRFKYDNETCEFITIEEWHEKYGFPAENKAPMVISDIEPYKSIVTGKEVGGRRQHREHLRAHDLVEVGNEKIKPKVFEECGATERRQDVIRAYKQHFGD